MSQKRLNQKEKSPDNMTQAEFEAWRIKDGAGRRIYEGPLPRIRTTSKDVGVKEVHKFKQRDAEFRLVIDRTAPPSNIDILDAGVLKHPESPEDLFWEHDEQGKRQRPRLRIFYIDDDHVGFRFGEKPIIEISSTELGFRSRKTAWPLLIKIIKDKGILASMGDTRARKNYQGKIVKRVERKLVAFINGPLQCRIPSDTEIFKYDSENGIYKSEIDMDRRAERRSSRLPSTVDEETGVEKEIEMADQEPASNISDENIKDVYSQETSAGKPGIKKMRLGKFEFDPVAKQDRKSRYELLKEIKEDIDKWNEGKKIDGGLCDKCAAALNKGADIQDPILIRALKIIETQNHPKQ